MKNRVKILILSILVISFSCQDEEYEMGEKLQKSDLNFTIEQDLSADAGGNTVVLTNKTPETVAVWDYETGKSTEQTVTVKYAFAGEYTIQFSAVTAGGVVDADPVTITVTEDNLNYVNDPLWNNLSGGVGNSKRWLLDLDAEGVSRYFVGPLYFYGTDNGWLEGGEDGCYGEDCWSWGPDWAGNTWLMDAADYGYMEFSLDGGPYVTVNHLTLPGLGAQEGTYYLDVDTHTLSMFDASMIHNSGYSSCVSNWGNMKVLSLTENTMQLGVIRESIGNCSGEGPAMLVYNFISQDYHDNWVPEETVVECDEGYEPTFASGELLEILTGGAGSGRYWKLDASGNPVDWIVGCQGWTIDATSSYNWGWNDAWTDIADEAWIRFDQWGGQTYTRFQGGVTTSGTFTINESTNEITLSGNNTLIQNADSWMSPTTSTITVIKGDNDPNAANGLWFGTSYNESTDEWLVFHYILGY